MINWPRPHPTARPNPKPNPDSYTSDAAVHLDPHPDQPGMKSEIGAVEKGCFDDDGGVEKWMG